MYECRKELLILIHIISLSRFFPTQINLLHWNNFRIYYELHVADQLQKNHTVSEKITKIVNEFHLVLHLCPSLSSFGLHFLKRNKDINFLSYYMPMQYRLCSLLYGDL